jgi:hypothetical protein
LEDFSLIPIMDNLFDDNNIINNLVGLEKIPSLHQRN